MSAKVRFSMFGVCISLITPVIEMYNYITFRQIYTVNTKLIEHSKATRKTLGSGLKEHFKFLLTMGPTELDKEV